MLLLQIVGVVTLNIPAFFFSPSSEPVEVNHELEIVLKDMALIYTLTLLEGTPLRNRPEGRPSLSGGLGPPSLQSCTSLTGQGSGLLSAAFYESWRHRS